MQTLCGSTIVPFKSDDGLGGGEILVSACKKSSTEIVVSVAVNLNAGAALPANARLRVTRADGDLAPQCGEVVGDMINISGLTTILDITTPANFRVFQFSLPTSSLCDATTALSTEKITVMTGGAGTPSALSNEFLIVPCE